MAPLTRADLPATPLVAVTLSEGTDEADARVLRLAQAEAEQSGVVLGRYLGVLDDPDAGLLCHVYATEG